MARALTLKVLGLTGGVGMGKSTCARLLAERHIPAVDTDELARQVVEPGQPALAEVRRVFGPTVLAPDGRLRRDELARRVFGHASARKQLEDILHPRIRELWRARVGIWHAEGRPLGVVIIPLLFETRAERELDATICLACSAASQYQRLLARGWSADQVEQRLRAQWPIDQKMALADYVIWTEGGLDIHAEQLDRILAKAQTEGNVMRDA